MAGVGLQVEDVGRLVGTVSEQVSAVSGQVTGISHHVHSLAMLNAFMASGQVLNFALSAVSLAATLKRLDQLSKQLDRIGAMIKGEFKRDREVAFRSAVQTARDVFETGNSGYRTAAAQAAINGLFQALTHFMQDCRDSLSSGDTPQHWLLAQQYLVRAMYAEVTRIRCYMMVGDLDMARGRLAEERVQFRDACMDLVRRWLGKYPAVYFHKDVPEDLLNRFLMVQHWLTAPDDVFSVSKQQVLSQSLLEHRGDFWESRANFWDAHPSRVDLRQKILRSPGAQRAQKLSDLTNAVTQAELLIENYQHLAGFSLELAEMRLSLEQWEGLVDQAELDRQRAAFIIDREALGAVARRLAL